MKVTKRQLRKAENAMKITKKQLQRIIKESLAEAYNSMSPRSKSLANAAKRQFAKDNPKAKVGIDTQEGWITVNGKKAVNMSQASGSPLSMGDIIDQMKQAYLGHDMEDKYAVLPADDDPAELARHKAYRDSIRLPEGRPGEHKLDFGKGIGTYNYRSEGANMKITKRQLRRIIKEEKARLHEYGDQQQSAADRAINTYFDVRMMESLTSLMDDMFHNAMEAAIEDGMFDEEAHDAVLAGIRKLVEGELKEMRH